MNKPFRIKSYGFGELAWEDAGYVGTEEGLRECGIVAIVCEKSHKGNPLTERRMASNRMKSSMRSRAEHVFGFHGAEHDGAGVPRSGSGERAKAEIATTNLVYNMCRLSHIKSYQAN